MSIFTETIDWEDGEEPTRWTVLPISSTERASLLALGDSLGERDLYTLASGRRALRRDVPKSAKPRCYWRNGIPVSVATSLGTECDS